MSLLFDKGIYRAHYTKYVLQFYYFLRVSCQVITTIRGAKYIGSPGTLENEPSHLILLSDLELPLNPLTGGGK
jgi:hypothetical protein